ncbi:hypothetical protein RhiirA5_382434 [Rhizophagus irregularis]|uniref:Uncharacterized protein n=3 Tax=Rhizophagus irregularis TaxID=588596 RepID=A0A2I1H8K5_9GLOM|nr:hypothetical protein GLOIN_2v1486355 [Rhizophagus irregularis DAOM 181602=DAOM 197198]EXX56809.1 hypothetical protein RirG_212750 [Rhizophagus irregularis DAOM 197198w]PKB95520.1 hypothetical protein RhiirA5_436563 [Rhizophagus irregularis]PKB95570.1 hypothetical protein RhiirA5_436472 [Rhizophagus irregularis]PKC00459.1 hypothetical protein RhiirA5_382434 [Rhizophagus irregularis]PKC55925.1 hypothetical protein RhiirA1_502140 [Rhizophagus irregularis]|eukprot:XP_025168153.1 hypothetical protein GLOIN_2v1486355 [Rhizophagus irregularis DAOM 181602=DAOM 197198]
MKFFTFFLALAIVAFSTFVAATPANQERGGDISRIPSANDNQKRDDVSTSDWKRGDDISRVGATKDNKNKRSLVGRQSKCPYGYHWCNDIYGGCCPNNTICTSNNKCASSC